MLSLRSWAVVGSHGKNPIADRLVAKLKSGNKSVFAVNPGNAKDGVLGSLKDIGEPIEVVDLVINPTKGVGVVEEMQELGIKNLWIQPGASSGEIKTLAQKYGIEVHEGCVLVEGKW
jgi:predicted CoA-binding protein